MHFSLICQSRLRILLLCLLHFSTCAVGEEVNRAILQRIVQRFENALGNMGQYAVAFRVEKNKCLQDSDFPDQNLLNQVSQTLQNQNNPVYQSNNLIAAKAIPNLQLHSEYRLRNLLGNILNVPDQCVVYFTVNSPCLTKCLSEGPYNIKASLTQLQNYVGIKALAFKKFWIVDEEGPGRQAVINRLMAIAPNLPYYQCRQNIPCARLHL